MEISGKQLREWVPLSPLLQISYSISPWGQWRGGWTSSPNRRATSRGRIMAIKDHLKGQIFGEDFYPKIFSFDGLQFLLISKVIDMKAAMVVEFQMVGNCLDHHQLKARGHPQYWKDLSISWEWKTYHRMHHHQVMCGAGWAIIRGYVDLSKWPITRENEYPIEIARMSLLNIFAKHNLANASLYCNV